MVVVTLICVCLPISLNHRRYYLDRAHSHDLESLATLSGTLTMMTADNKEGERHDSIANDYRRAVMTLLAAKGDNEDTNLFNENMLAGGDGMAREVTDTPLHH